MWNERKIKSEEHIASFAICDKALWLDEACFTISENVANCVGKNTSLDEFHESRMI